MTDTTTRLDDLLGGDPADHDQAADREQAADPRRAADPEATIAEPVDGDPAQGDADDDLFDDDALLAPARRSRLTIVLVALLIFVIGFLAGVQVERFLGR